VETAKPGAPHNEQIQALEQPLRDVRAPNGHSMKHSQFSLFSRLDTPFVTTLHGRLDLPELQAVFNTFPKAPVVSISDSQRLPLPQANWLDTIYHGLPEGLLTPRTQSEPEYLAFLGRMRPEKRSRH
jgi:hypothetical protein